MRTTWMLVAIGLVICLVLTPARYVVRASSQKKAGPIVDVKPVSWEVKGWGRNQEESELHALKNARKLLLEHLAKQKPPITYEPSLAYVKKHLVAGTAQRLPEFDEKVNEDVRAQCWMLPITLSPEQFRSLRAVDLQMVERQRKQERDARTDVRLVSLGRVLIAMLAFLIGFYGYSRLEELTKGYYTAWLRVGVAGFLAAVGAGLWLLS